MKPARNTFAQMSGGKRNEKRKCVYVVYCNVCLD
jgi:hypothetical protein